MESEGSGMTFSKWWKKENISKSDKSILQNEGEINTFPGTQVLREFVVSRPALQEILKENLWAEKKWHQTVTEFTERKEDLWKMATVWKLNDIFLNNLQVKKVIWKGH